MSRMDGKKTHTHTQYQAPSNEKKCTTWMATAKDTHETFTCILSARLKTDEIPASTECGDQRSAEKMLNPMMLEDVTVAVVDVKDLEFTTCRLVYIYENRCLKVYR